jgi:futalosine hydrolase
MRILIVAATDMEVAPLAAFLPDTSDDTRPRTGRYRGHGVDVLVTGVGMVATAAWCSRALAAERYDLALNFGVCGSFDARLAPGSVAHVVADRISELGAEDGDAFLTVQELKLLGDNEFPFVGGQLVNPAPPANAALLELPAVEGITVNTAHGRAASIAAVVARFNPRVESMEGAAFMYSCLLARVPFAQVRAVSNRIETRNRGAWDMAGAIASLGRAATRILDHV